MDDDIYNFNFSFEKFSVDGALFDIEKINNISKERLSRLNKKEFTDQVLSYAHTYNSELEQLILRDNWQGRKDSNLR